MDGMIGRGSVGPDIAARLAVEIVLTRCVSGAEFLLVMEGRENHLEGFDKKPEREGGEVEMGVVERNA